MCMASSVEKPIIMLSGFYLIILSLGNGLFSKDTSKIGYLFQIHKNDISLYILENIFYNIFIYNINTFEYTRCRL